MDLSILLMSHRWIYITCDLLCLASFHLRQCLQVSSVLSYIPEGLLSCVQTFSRACPLANLCILREAIPLEMSFRACQMLTHESSSTNRTSSFSPPFPPSAHPSHLPVVVAVSLNCHRKPSQACSFLSSTFLLKDKGEVVLPCWSREKTLLTVLNSMGEEAETALGQQRTCF